MVLYGTRFWEKKVATMMEVLSLDKVKDLVNF